MRRFLANATLFVAALLVGFAVCEVIVRVLYGDETMLYPRYQTDYRYGPYVLRGIRPNSDFRHSSAAGSWRFVTNSRGFRNDRDFPYAKPAGTLRVLSLGDSHTQGYEVRQEATFSAVLERALRARGVTAEVMNAGVSGFGTAEELAFLENEGVRYHPDVVAVGFFSNDFEDNVKSGLFDLDAAGALVPRGYSHIPGVAIQNVIYAIPGIQWLSEHSYFYSLLFNDVWNFFKLRLAVKAAHEASEEAGPARAAHQASGTAGTAKAADAAFDYALPTSANASDYQVALALALLRRMQAFCTAHGIRLIMVDIPEYVAPYRGRTSMPTALRTGLDTAHIEYIPSESLFALYQGATELHVIPGYHHHISEFSHALIGAELARRVAGRSGRAGQ